MFDLSSERLLENEERFAPRNGHRFVEIWECGDARPPIYRSGDLKEKEIASWIHEERSANGPIQSGLRVLLCPKPAGKPSSGKLPFSQETFRQLSQAWRIPSTFLRAIAQKLSVVTRCSVAPVCSVGMERSAASLPNSPRSPRHRVATFSSLPASPVKERVEEEGILDDRKSSISDSATCLLVRGDVDWTWDYTMLLIHDPAAHMTYAIVVGLTAIEIDLIQSYLSSPAITGSSLSTHPILLPVLLLDLATDETASLLKIRIKLLSQIQQQTGMDRFNSLRSANVSGRTSIGGREKERHELDLDAVMLRLTCLSDWVAAQRGFVSIQQRVVGVIEEMLCSVPQSPGTSPAAYVKTQFTERLSFISQSLYAAEQKCQYLERSISAQVQTIYSLIGQKDNRLNIALQARLVR
ncbi:hypothetical protein BDV96DRAFT_643966 [Lophiotrema nucula]|uniref:Uncharacterized protein n=1 Tax=Lophiotrema nucula TaxID=690887 RepID=A0A6A5ZF84_9PLEO|nr:hypothetical protein BDV96DRAFT_643966 [Lophiotrema nucula]